MTMRNTCLIAQIVGALIAAIGVVGAFEPMSHDDGALAISGAVIFASGLLSMALLNRERNGPKYNG